MIQTLGDVFLLVAILSIGLVSFLLAVFLYHLIFIVMDLRQVARRTNAITAEVEELLVKPVEIVAQVIDWVQKMIWDAYILDEAPKKKSRKASKGKKKKKKRSGFKAKKV